MLKRLIVTQVNYQTSISEVLSICRVNHVLRCNVIPHLHNLFLFQCDVTRSLNCYEAQSKLFIDQLGIDCYGILANTGVMLCLHR